jgi:hypothetical protein
MSLERDAMRIWDVPASLLCRQHLLGEHRELHGLWRILTENRHGYSHHPETRRWRGKLAALYQRHEALSEEIGRRGYRHASPLDRRQATGSAVQNDYVDSLDAQFAILRNKGCDCAVPNDEHNLRL